MNYSDGQLRRKIAKLADRLLDGYQVPPIHQSHMITTLEAWEILLDLDLLQDDLAGGHTWSRDAEAREIRTRLARESRDLIDRTAAIELDDVGRTLTQIAESLDAYSRNSSDGEPE